MGEGGMNTMFLVEGTLDLFACLLRQRQCTVVTTAVPNKRQRNFIYCTTAKGAVWKHSTMVFVWGVGLGSVQ